MLEKIAVAREQHFFLETNTLLDCFREIFKIFSTFPNSSKLVWTFLRTRKNRTRLEPSASQRRTSVQLTYEGNIFQRIDLKFGTYFFSLNFMAKLS